ncbi:TetR/AcrR family transcriptional regulator [Kutzneria buriramensis]|uniref:AcrR family transcriptional regulator n=1 Tax=Kutzneria buriramensis TaxID=1045776 RepID=A0A3E0HFJ5_9PSEU|nr:TetR/AcrR family transcriptional regulator [Kutzneria buriramensis]REH44523.1 AcrR family transcriptional regulator [Kutzneria buriramensis]
MADTRRNSALRELTRQAVRARIAEAAMALFVANGYERTTVDHVAESVGMSARSVFRYFPTKEDMVVGHLDEVGVKIADALEARPTTESAWTAVRHALKHHIEELAADPETNLAIATMLIDAPSLLPALLAKQARWVDGLAPNLTQRLDGPLNLRPLKARAIAFAALACLNNAVDEWTRTGGAKPVGRTLDALIAAVRG